MLPCLWATKSSKSSPIGEKLGHPATDVSIRLQTHYIGGAGNTLFYMVYWFPHPLHKLTSADVYPCGINCIILCIGND
jgi:hypothetical protein